MDANPQEALHPQASPAERLTKHCAEIYLMPKCSNVGLWHLADLRLAAPQGPLTVPLPTLRPECRFTSTFQTLLPVVLNVGT